MFAVTTPILLCGPAKGQAQGTPSSTQLPLPLRAQSKARWIQSTIAKHLHDYAGAYRAWQQALRIPSGRPGFREAIDKPAPRTPSLTGQQDEEHREPFTHPGQKRSPTLTAVETLPSEGIRHSSIPVEVEHPSGPSASSAQLKADAPSISSTVQTVPPVAVEEKQEDEIAPTSPPALAHPTNYRPPPGHTRTLKVPKVEASPLIDGNLSDAVWKDAPLATDFWVSEYDQAPLEPTEVRVLADDKALYFAFHCYDSHPTEIHAQQLKRDSSLGVDDQVTIELDPYHNYRQVSSFSVNAIGTQADARAGGRASNIEWKGDWQAATQRVDDGWTAELAIPFAILNFRAGNDTFGVNFVRYHHRTQQYSRWANVTSQFLAEETGSLTGLILPHTIQKNNLNLLQYATAGFNTPNKTGTIRDLLATTGFDLRYDHTKSLTSLFSLNPDFSQVEDDVVGLAFDYNEKFRTDGRPFFQEGSGFLPNRTYFYSRRVPNFNLGLKSFGKIGPFQLGLLGVQAPEGRRDYALRVLREIGPTLGVSLIAVGTKQAQFNNNLLALSAGGRFGTNLSVDATLATTSTQGKDGDGQQSNLTVTYLNPHWQTGVSTDQVDNNFFPADGFIASDVLGTRGRSAFFSYNNSYGDGKFRNLNASLTYETRDTSTGLLQRRKYSAYIGGETRSNIYFNLGTTQGPYRPRGKNAGEWSSQTNDDRFYTASLFFDTGSDRHGYGLTYSWGFLGGGDYSNLSPSFWVKPTRNTYLSYSHERTESFGILSQSVLSASWDLNAEQSLSFRWVKASGDYGGNSYRVAFRRQVRNGVDVYAVFNTDPFSKNRFTIKFVRAFGIR